MGVPLMDFNTRALQTQDDAHLGSGRTAAFRGRVCQVTLFRLSCGGQPAQLNPCSNQCMLLVCGANFEVLPARICWIHACSWWALEVAKMRLPQWTHNSSGGRDIIA